MSGNHRASVLSAINDCAEIPVVFEKCEFLKPRDKMNNRIYRSHCTMWRFLSNQPSLYPNQFTSKNISNWPAVQSGYITTDLAINILEKYIGN